MSRGRLDELPERVFAPNDATRELVRGKDATLGHFVDHQINKPKWDAWKALPEAVRTGQVAFAVAHGGLDMHQARRPLHWGCPALVHGAHTARDSAAEPVAVCACRSSR